MTKPAKQIIDSIIGPYFIKKSLTQLQEDIKDFRHIHEHISHEDSIKIMSNIQTCINEADNFQNKIRDSVENKLYLEEESKAEE